MMIYTYDVYLTENEHYCFEEILREVLEQEGLTIEYKKYEPHKPMHREVVIQQQDGGQENKILDVLTTMTHVSSVYIDGEIKR